MDADGCTRIAFCITDLDVGGAERALVQLATRLDRQRFAPHVFCLMRRGPLADELESHGVPVTCFGVRGLRSGLVVLKLARALRRFRPTLLQTVLYHANIAGRIAGRLAGVPRIVSGIRVAERRSRWRLWIDRRTQRLVDRHVCVSEAVATFSIEQGGLAAERVVVIPNGVDFERFANARPADLGEFGIPAGCPVILFVGRLDPQKAPEILLRACERIFREFAEAHLLCVGDGRSRKEIQRWTANHNLPGRVHLAGRRDDVPALMKAATALALPSRWEGLPNVILEAMAAGLPVVASDVDGVSELVQNGKTGLLVAPDAPDQFAATLESILRDPARGAAMGGSAQAAVRDWSWEAMVRRYEELYAKLLGKGMRDDG